MKKDKTVTMVDIEVEMTQETYDKLVKLGLKWVKEDKTALVNYAANKILKEAIEK